uniref:Uncharacterized protein n=1 Tax=Takifugu rubripes TaxID=31033 RepID=A0A674PQ34_TAKRU
MIYPVWLRCSVGQREVPAGDYFSLGPQATALHQSLYWEKPVRADSCCVGAQLLSQTDACTADQIPHVFLGKQRRFFIITCTLSVICWLSSIQRLIHGVVKTRGSRGRKERGNEPAKRNMSQSGRGGLVYSTISIKEISLH